MFDCTDVPFLFLTSQRHTSREPGSLEHLFRVFLLKKTFVCKRHWQLCGLCEKILNSLEHETAQQESPGTCFSSSWLLGPLDSPIPCNHYNQSSSQAWSHITKQYYLWSPWIAHLQPFTGVDHHPAWNCFSSNHFHGPLTLYQISSQAWSHITRLYFLSGPRVFARVEHHPIWKQSWHLCWPSCSHVAKYLAWPWPSIFRAWATSVGVAAEKESEYQRKDDCFWGSVPRHRILT